MPKFLWIALSAMAISFAAIATANAVPDYITRYWEARQPHPGMIDQDQPAVPAPTPGR